MPLTKFQSEIARLLAPNRSPESHLAGGAAIHIAPNSRRYSNDLDYFNDSEERVAQSFATDRDTLLQNGFDVEIGMTQPGFVRATVSRGEESTKIEWAHDSAWRFMPPIPSLAAGYMLHPIDLAINKLLALVGRDEPRDFLDILDLNERELPLGAMCWAAAGKDPGFTPRSILEILRRRGKYRPEDFARLDLKSPVNLPDLKQKWLKSLEQAEAFILSRPPDEIGCLYYSPSLSKFVEPSSDQESTSDVVVHFGRPGGVLPRLKENR